MVLQEPCPFLVPAQVAVPQVLDFPLNQAEEETAMTPTRRRHTRKRNALINRVQEAARGQCCGGPPLAPPDIPALLGLLGQQGPGTLAPLGFSCRKLQQEAGGEVGCSSLGPPGQGQDGLSEPLPSSHSAPSPGSGHCPHLWNSCLR